MKLRNKLLIFGGILVACGFISAFFFFNRQVWLGILLLAAPLTVFLFGFYFPDKKKKNKPKLPDESTLYTNWADIE